MKNRILNSTLIICFLFLFGCKSDNVEGIVLENTLVVHQSFTQNKKMASLIKSALDKDSNSFNRLIHFPNGGGESSYNLGYVITQIIYKVGENGIIEMIRNYNKRDMKYLESCIGVGLAYGDNDYNGIMDNTKYKDEFPKLFEYIKKRTKR